MLNPFIRITYIDPDGSKKMAVFIQTDIVGALTTFQDEHPTVGRGQVLQVESEVEPDDWQPCNVAVVNGIIKQVWDKAPSPIFNDDPSADPVSGFPDTFPVFCPRCRQGLYPWAFVQDRQISAQWVIEGESIYGPSCPICGEPVKEEVVDRLNWAMELVWDITQMPYSGEDVRAIYAEAMRTLHEMLQELTLDERRLLCRLYGLWGPRPTLHELADEWERALLEQQRQVKALLQKLGETASAKRMRELLDITGKVAMAELLQVINDLFAAVARREDEIIRLWVRITGLPVELVSRACKMTIAELDLPERDIAALEAYFHGSYGAHGLPVPIIELLALGEARLQKISGYDQEEFEMLVHKLRDHGFEFSEV